MLSILHARTHIHCINKYSLCRLHCILATFSVFDISLPFALSLRIPMYLCYIHRMNNLLIWSASKWNGIYAPNMIYIKISISLYTYISGEGNSRTQNEQLFEANGNCCSSVETNSNHTHAHTCSTFHFISENLYFPFHQRHTHMHTYAYIRLIAYVHKKLRMYHVNLRLLVMF